MMIMMTFVNNRLPCNILDYKDHYNAILCMVYLFGDHDRTEFKRVMKAEH